MRYVFLLTVFLFGVNCTLFLLAVTIKQLLKKYIKNYSETVECLNENIFADEVIGSQCSVEQELSITLESVHIFKETSICGKNLLNPKRVMKK